METVDKETWQVRATAWELAAFSYRHPTRETAEVVASGEWLAAACEIADALDLALPDDFGEGVPSVGSPLDDSAVDSFFHEFRAEATRLFVGPSEPVCSSYEGVWRAKAEGVKPLLFVSTHAMEVERFVKSCGFTRPEGTNDPFDHVATECELLEALALRAVQGAGDADESGSGNGASASGLYAQFLNEHMRAWVNDFCTALSKETREPFYRAAAMYLRALVR